MTETFVLPNWHVILIHYPLGLLMAGVLIELLSFLWRAGSVRAAGRWMILLGALSGIPTATSGIYALRDVVSPVTDQDVPWHQVVAANTWNDQQWKFMTDHVLLAAWGTVLAVLAVVMWIAASDCWRRRLYWPSLILLLIACGLLSSAAWHSGEAVYRFRTAVGDFDSVTRPDASHSPTVLRFVPPLQLHVLLAGVTVAIAAGALALSLRRCAEEKAALQSPDASGITTDPVADVLAGRPLDASRPLAAAPCTYPGRVWLAAFLAAVATALAGIWYWGVFPPDEILTRLRSYWSQGELRRPMHISGGVLIILLTLILAAVGRWSPRRRGLSIILIALLLVVVVGQTFGGVLMMYDSHRGPILRFNTPGPSPAKTAVEQIKSSVSEIKPAVEEAVDKAKSAAVNTGTEIKSAATRAVEKATAAVSPATQPTTRP